MTTLLTVNNALPTIGRGAKNTAAAFLTRSIFPTRFATRTGIGPPPPSAASSDMNIPLVAGPTAVDPSARATSSGEPSTFRLSATDGLRSRYNAGLRRSSVVFLEAVHLSITDPRQRNSAPITIGPGATNTTAASLIARTHPTLGVKRTGIGPPPPSAARGAVVITNQGGWCRD